jgi:DNA repair exonuclease SbcCD ATPase subunit
VENLNGEIENMMAKCDLNSVEEKKGFSSHDVHQFQTQLESSKVAMEHIQQHPEASKNSMSELELRNSQQSEKIAADAKEIAMLRQQIVKLQEQATIRTQQVSTMKKKEKKSKTGLSPSTPQDGRANDFSQSHHGSVAQGHGGCETCHKEPQIAHEREVSRMKIEIESLSKQLATVSVKEQDLKEVKENVRMLEEEAKSRMEAMAEFRSQAHSLQHDLKLARKALKSAEDGHAGALEQVKQLQEKIRSMTREHLSESQSNLLDRSELLSQLKASNQETKQLRIERDKSKSSPCEVCESKNARFTKLEQEQNRLEKMLEECRAQSADKEGQYQVPLKGIFFFFFE